MNRRSWVLLAVGHSLLTVLGVIDLGFALALGYWGWAAVLFVLVLFLALVCAYALVRAEE